jgi:hypothetical protein
MLILILWEEGGRAAILCNCSGTFAAGYSSLFAVTPSGGRLKPAFELGHREEGMIVFELDVSRLVLPRRSTKDTKSPVGHVHVYDLKTAAAGTEIIPVNIRPQEQTITTRAILNPVLFSIYGKIMRVAFVGVEAYGNLNEESVSKQGFECYSVLGHSDMMITHLHQSAYTMIVDISESILWKLPTGLRMSPQAMQDNSTFAKFPYFEVTTFHKVLGVKVADKDYNAFNELVPSGEELDHIIALGRDWNDEKVNKGARDKFIERNWVLGTTTIEPGEIDAIMTNFFGSSNRDTRTTSGL